MNGARHEVERNDSAIVHESKVNSVLADCATVRAIGHDVAVKIDNDICRRTRACIDGERQGSKPLPCAIQFSQRESPRFK